MTRLAAVLALTIVGAALVLSCASPSYEAPPTPTTHEEAPVSEQPPALSPSETSAEGAATGGDEEGPIVIDVSAAVLLALENNPALAVRKAGPVIQETFEDEEAAEFDPVLSAEGAHERERSERISSTPSGLTSAVNETNDADVSVSKYFSTGTDVALEAGVTQSTSGSGRLDSTRVGLTVTQALLRGASRDANLVSLRQAQLDTLSSRYELRGFTEQLVAAVEIAYWDYVLAERRIEIFAESLRIAEQALGEMEERIRIGTLAEIELAAGQAEVALRREALISAKGALETSRLRLIQLMNPPGPDIWDRPVTPTEEPRGPEGGLDDVADHVALALRMRPELNAAHLAVRQDDLELVKTRNGLLPRLDLFITLGKTGYARSFAPSVDNLDGDSYDISTGLAFEYPFANRARRAQHERATLNRAQASDALRNLERLVELDVRTAHILVRQAAEQVAATAATRRLQEETVRGEAEKFRVGKSTAFLLAQAQRDLVAGQIGEVRALVNYKKALVDLYLLDGSLLLRRAIDAPGAEPLSNDDATGR